MNCKHNHRSKDFELLHHECFFTDDSLMSLAVCDALLRSEPDYSNLGDTAVESMQRIGRPYPHCDMLPSYRTMKYKSPIWGYFHVQKE